MAVGFTTTCAISAYHDQRCEFDSRSWRGVFDTTLCNKFVSDLRKFDAFLRVLWFPLPITTFLDDLLYPSRMDTLNGIDHRRKPTADLRFVPHSITVGRFVQISSFS